MGMHCVCVWYTKLIVRVSGDKSIVIVLSLGGSLIKKASGFLSYENTIKNVTKTSLNDLVK